MPPFLKSDFNSPELPKVATPIAKPRRVGPAITPLFLSNDLIPALLANGVTRGEVVN